MPVDRVRARSGLIALLAVTTILLGPAPLAAQSTTGELVGTVHDPANSSVYHASVHVREINTGAVRDAFTNERGDFLIRALPIGHYEVTVEAQGFKKASRTDVQLNVEASVRTDFVLEVGATSETVTVSAVAAQIETERGTVENRVLNDQMILLPLNGRDRSWAIGTATGPPPSES